MRDRFDPRLRLGRVLLVGYETGDDHNGAYEISGPAGRKLFLIVSNGDDWEHASVSVKGQLTATPTWAEMCFVKDLVWADDEVVIQYHPAKSRYVNIHPGTLHLWRPIGQTVLTPPLEMV